MLIPNRLINENAHMCIYVCACACCNKRSEYPFISNLCSTIMLTQFMSLQHASVSVCMCESYACLVVLASTTQLGAGEGVKINYIW